MTDDVGFEAQLTYLAYRITAKLTLVANRLFRQHGLDIYSSRILLLLLDTGDRTVGSLVDAMALPQSTISHQLIRLEKQRLLTRRRGAQDNRVVNVTLTEEGGRVAQAVRVFSRRINRAMLQDLDPVERLVLPRSLAKLIATLDRDDLLLDVEEGELARLGPSGKPPGVR